MFCKPKKGEDEKKKLLWFLLGMVNYIKKEQLGFAQI